MLALVDLVEEGHLDVTLLMNMMHIGVRSQTNPQQLAIYLFQFGFYFRLLCKPFKGK